jgi:tetratricopeptide (TPR) repeat protein
VFLKPHFYMALSNLGLACRELEMYPEGEAALGRALEIQPQGPQALVNLGCLMQDLGRLEEALPLLERACAAALTDGDPWAALSALHLQRGEVSAAEKAARSGLVQDPDNPDVRLALAHAELSQRHFAAGWEHYEARMASAGSPVRKLPGRCWVGDRRSGQSLLVYGEQGLGDEIMFASCLGDLVAAGNRVVLDCDPRLRSLFRRSFPDVQVAGEGADYRSPAALSRFDGCVPIGSLPRYFRTKETDFPPGRPYLHADVQLARQWGERLARQGTARRRVGIAWRGGLARTGRQLRSLRVEALQPLLEARGITWVVLQRDAAAEEIAVLRKLAAPDALVHADVPADLDELAAVMHNLDLVITVCSTVVHLSGALGRPVRVLTPKGAAWRYPSNGSSLPWYADVTMLRQSMKGDWTEAMATLCRELGQ